MSRGDSWIDNIFFPIKNNNNSVIFRTYSNDSLYIWKQPQQEQQNKKQTDIQTNKKNAMLNRASMLHDLNYHSLPYWIYFRKWYFFLYAYNIYVNELTLLIKQITCGILRYENRF